MTTQSQFVLEQLKTVSTATINTHLFKRGIRGAAIAGVTPVGGQNVRMAGPAFTLRYIPAREDIDTLAVFAQRDWAQYHAVDVIPEGHVLVVDANRNVDVSSLGSILAARLLVRGAAGVVTDGGLRDADQIAETKFPAFHQRPAIKTNITSLHAADYNTPIGCGGVAVYPGDVVVGDANGVVVIPQHLAAEIAHECVEQELHERFIRQEVLDGRPLFGTYPPDEAALARWQSSMKPPG